MLKTYPALTSAALLPGTGFAYPVQALPEKVSLDDPAFNVMSDLERISAVLIRPDDSIDEANRRMIQRGVRLLLVVDDARAVGGLITANDLLGEKPMQVITQRGGRRQDIVVRDIMTPQHQLEVLHMRDVAHARVGHIVATLKESARQHAIVADVDANGRQRVRGLFSLTQIARQLGLELETSEVARTFSEIEALLTH
jgi:signal-transduction protein with cAMP-binding, CBS, and nucleotidyltransferase domain